MARPRVFISSTFYDLRQIRTDLETFVRDLGYDPVLFERGHVAYGRDQKLEEYCYAEIDLCDVVVSIVGGRFGSTSQRDKHSISQQELLTALKKGKQVYIFIEKGVHNEYRTYLANKETVGIKYHFADNPAVYKFIEECEALPVNNPIHDFESAQDIVKILREQWAGLFQRFLQNEGRKKQDVAFQDIEATAKTLKELVDFLTKDKLDTHKTVRDILIHNHPLFARLRSLLNVHYRIFFTSMKELDTWLEARGYDSGAPVQEDEEAWTFEWHQRENPANEDRTRYRLLIPSRLFEDNGLLKVPPSDWDESTVRLEKEEAPETVAGGGPDDIPF